MNVSVSNKLDSNLDWNTLQIENISHTNRVEITEAIKWNLSSTTSTCLIPQVMKLDPTAISNIKLNPKAI